MRIWGLGHEAYVGPKFILFGYMDPEVQGLQGC